MSAKMGRPSKYTQELADEICRRIADDESLVSICKSDHMPARDNVRLWQRMHPDFQANFVRAREEQGHSAADVIGDIRKGVLAGDIPPDVGRAAADMAKWEASRRASKHYGDKLQVDNNVRQVPDYDLGRLEATELDEWERLLAKTAHISADTPGES